MRTLELKTFLPELAASIQKYPRINSPFPQVKLPACLNGSENTEDRTLMMEFFLALGINKEIFTVLPDLANHHMRVGHIAFLIAIEYGLDKSQALRVAIAGLVHDLGKIKMPERLMRPTYTFNHQGQDRNQMRQHVKESVDLLLQSEQFDDATISIVAQHHEKIDGSGYPHGLKGDQISTEGQIVSIADVYDAMTDPARSWRKPLKQKEAHQAIQQLSEGQTQEPIWFKKDVFEAFNTIAIENFPREAA